MEVDASGQKRRFSDAFGECKALAQDGQLTPARHLMEQHVDVRRGLFRTQRHQKSQS